MDFIPENELESLLLGAARGSRLTQPLKRALLSTTIYVLGRIKGKTETGSGKGTGTRVDLYGTTAGGRRMIPVFSSERRISDFIRTDQPYVPSQSPPLIRCLSTLCMNELSRWGAPAVTLASSGVGLAAMLISTGITGADRPARLVSTLGLGPGIVLGVCSAACSEAGWSSGARRIAATCGFLVAITVIFAAWRLAQLYVVMSEVFEDGGDQ